jgi:biotin operon repressor
MEVRRVTAEIRVACKVELPQHVEELTPIATREVVGIRVPPLPKAPERPARVSKGGRAAAMPVSARAPVVAPVAPEPVSARVMEVNPNAAPGMCRMKGCGRAVHARGACSPCYQRAKRECPDLLLPATQLRASLVDAAAERARVLELVTARPGIGPSVVMEALGIAESATKHHLRMLLQSGALVAEHRGTYRAADAAPVAPVNLTDRLEALLRKTGKIRPETARMALGVSSESMSAAAKNLRDKGRMKKVAGPGRGWLELAR